MNPTRALLASLWIAACLAPGWLPGRRGPDACMMLGWAALVAPALGALAAQHARGVFALAVLGWVWANGVDKDATEAAVEGQIEAQKNPPIVAPPLPWSV